MKGKVVQFTYKEEMMTCKWATRFYNEGDAVEEHESQAEMPILVSLLVLDLD